eukprot:363275-Chlamydomonas_euryale.AAC.10
MLAGTGGLMVRPGMPCAHACVRAARTSVHRVTVAVCVIELWPEARACKNDRGMAIGIAIGSLLMSWTLYAGPG